MIYSPPFVSFRELQGNLGLTHAAHAAKVEFPPGRIARLPRPKVFVEPI